MELVKLLRLLNVVSLELLQNFLQELSIYSFENILGLHGYIFNILACIFSTFSISFQ